LWIQREPLPHCFWQLGLEAVVLIVNDHICLDLRLARKRKVEIKKTGYSRMLMTRKMWSLGINLSNCYIWIENFLKPQGDAAGSDLSCQKTLSVCPDICSLFPVMTITHGKSLRLYWFRHSKKLKKITWLVISKINNFIFHVLYSGPLMVSL
jgi:hypothetical protein